MDGAAVTFRGTERFQLSRLIGRGGMGVVYEAVDAVNATRVALKLLPLVSPDLLLRFKREFRIVANIRHRNLVRLGDLVAHDAQWFFTMELVDGIDFVSYVRGDRAREPAAPIQVVPRGAAADTVPAEAPSPKVPAVRRIREERLRPALAQLAEALGALHGAGCVHRDVKPSNVLVTRGGRVVLLDFGLASTSTVETTLVGAGTPAYMAPEQAAQTPITAAADWYAFGVILFELLAGRLPFEGLPHEILYRKQHERPPRTRAAAPEAPADLAALCDRLLETNPSERPEGAEVLAQLSGAGPASSRGAAAEPRVQLMGREDELGTLTAALETVRAGGGPLAVVVRGESGVGKSALVESLVESAAAREEWTILIARCYERELVPFKAVDGIVDVLTRVLRQLEPETLQALLPARTDTLLQAFPVLGRVDAIARIRRDALDRDPGEVRASMFAAFRDLLAGLGLRSPVLAVIDDLQWADGDSLALLADALAGPDGPRMLLLGTLRPAKGDDPTKRLFPQKVREQDLPLANLPQPVARELARRLLAASGTQDVDADSAVVARESSGHPLFLLELARTAHLRAGDDRPVTLDSVLKAQIDALSLQAVRLLRALAIAGAPLRLAVARKAAGLDGAAMVGALDDLRSARLVHSGLDRGDEVVDIAHDRIRQVLRMSTVAIEAAELHESLARAFEDSGDPLRAAEHWRDAGRQDRAAVHFAAAGRRAVEVLAFDRAASAFQMALAIDVWSEDQKRELSIGLADALSNAGRGAAAAMHYLSAAEKAGTGVALDLRRRATEELLRSGHVDKGREVAARALADAGLEFPRSPLRALLWLRMKLRVRGLRFQRRALEEIAPRELARIDLCWSLSSGLALTDPIQGAHFQVRGLLLALRAGEISRVTRGIAGEAGYAAALGDQRGSSRRIREAEALAREMANPHATGTVALMRGLSNHLGGRFGAALQDLDTAERIFRESCVGTAWELNAARQFSLECLYYLGELSRFKSSAAEGLKEAEDRGTLYASTTLRTGLTNGVWLIRDDPARARVEVDEAMQLWTSRGYHVQHWYELIARTQIDLYVGSGEAAWARMEQSWPSLAGSGLLRLRHTRIVAAHLKARAAVAAAVDGLPAQKHRLLAIARACARTIWREGDGWNRVLAAGSYAGLERVAGRRDRAGEWLRQMSSLATEQGLALHAAAAAICGKQPYGTEWMVTHGVQRPAAMVRMLLPGWSEGV